MVAFIIGLASTLVVMTIPDSPSEEVRAAQKFETALEQAQDRAILTGQPVGLMLDDRSYRFAAWFGEAWRPVRGGQTLARGMRIEKAGEVNEALPEGWPIFVFDPTGVLEEAQFTLRGRGEQINFFVDASGDVRFEAQ